MGSCMSSDGMECESQKPTTAKIISLRGNLLEYKVPIYVSQVLQAETSPYCFLCNCDHLLFDDYIPVLDSDEELQPNQIYFVLPTSKLQYKLSASDMAALAVKASVALQNGSKKESRRRKRARISPVLSVNHHHRHKDKISLLERRGGDAETEVIIASDSHKSYYKTIHSGAANIGISRSASVRKLHRFTSRRAKLAVRSFRLGLATIYEGIVM